jgi:hypothetical protein
MSFSGKGGKISRDPHLCPSVLWDSGRCQKRVRLGMERVEGWGKFEEILG